MTYLEQKIAIDTYANYLRIGYPAWITRILDDYNRLLTQLRENGELGEVTEKLYHYSYQRLNQKLMEISERAATHNAVALDDISAQLDELARKAEQGL